MSRVIRPSGFGLVGNASVLSTPLRQVEGHIADRWAAHNMAEIGQKSTDSDFEGQGVRWDSPPSAAVITIERERRLDYFA